MSDKKDETTGNTIGAEKLASIQERFAELEMRKAKAAAYRRKHGAKPHRDKANSIWNNQDDTSNTTVSDWPRPFFPFF